MEENVIQTNDGITINVDVGIKNIMYVKKIIYGTFYMYLQKRKVFYKYYGWFSDYMYAIIESSDEETKNIPKNFNEKKATCKTQNFCILLAFLWIAVALLMAVRIYCYLINYRAKQKHLLPFQDTNNELREVLFQ